MKFVILAAALIVPGASAPPSPQSPPVARDGAEPSDSAERFDRMNLYRPKAGCTPIERQVAGEDRRYGGTRLDRQPPGELLLAVDRHVDGCHEIVRLRDERLRR